MEKVDRLGWAVQDNYRIADALVGVRCNSVPFADALREILAGFETDEEVRPTLAVRFEPSTGSATIKDYHVVLRGTDHVIRTLDAERLLSGALQEVGRRALKGRDDVVLLQAMTAVGNGHAVLLPFLPGRTRLRLASLLERDGYSLVDGSMTAVSMESGHVVPAPAPFALEPGVLERVLALCGPSPGRERGIFRLPGARPLAAAVAWGRVDEPPLDISRAAMVQVLAGGAYNRAALRSRVILPLCKALTGARCSLISSGATVPERVRELLPPAS